MSSFPSSYRVVVPLLSLPASGPRDNVRFPDSVANMNMDVRRGATILVLRWHS